MFSLDHFSSHHGEWQAVEVQHEFVGNVLFSNLVRDIFDERVLWDTENFLKQRT